MTLAGVDVLASGYQLAEAPRADGRGGVYFTDVLGGGIYRWSDDGLDVVVPEKKGAGGLALHVDGGVVASGRDIIHIEPDGTRRFLFSAPEGVSGFNDLCATAEGHLLVGGLRFRPFAGEDPVPGAFWYVTAPERGEVVLDGIDWPNGVGDLGNGTWVFCDYSAGTVTYDRGGARRVVRTPNGEADGLAIDDEGGVWVALGGGGAIVRLDEHGKASDTVELAGHFVTSLAFDGDTMYVTTARLGPGEDGCLLRLAAPVRGRRHHLCSI